MAKELVPIVFSYAIWAPLLARSHTEFQCDNLSLVEAINKGNSKDPMVMHLLRCLWFLQALFNIAIIASHITGVQKCFSRCAFQESDIEIFAETLTVFPHAGANSITAGANGIPTEARLDLP